MSGKTTFMKTLALNLVLAQTLGICLARRASLPPVRVMTVIGRDESTTSGQSYFFREASELRRMLGEALASGREHWFVIDEPFRGTNSAERVGAGYAVLKYLNEHWLVVASTHDQELIDLLRPQFDAYHFSEVVTDAGAWFDYRLRPGPCRTRNAVKMLVLAGYPPAVTDLAEKTAASALTCQAAKG